MGAGDASKDYAAGFAADVATIVTGHPFDTVKVKLQAHSTNTQVKEYRNALQCSSRILNTEGVKGSYRGASSSFIGMAIESSISFGLYSQTKQLLRVHFELREKLKAVNRSYRQFFLQEYLLER